MPDFNFFISFILLSFLSTFCFAQEEMSTIQLEIGKCDTLRIDSSGKEKYSYLSGNQDIANVNQEGIVCGINKGSTEITAVSNKTKKSYLFKIEITGNPDKEVVENASDLDNFETLCNESARILDTDYSFDKNEITHSILKVSENKRYLENTENGQPFLFLSQTLWGMTRRLGREEIIAILDICVNQGFTSIQLIAHSHYMGKNVYGDTPFYNDNFLCPILTAGNNPENEQQYDWWDHLDFIISECIKRDLIICLLPTWREQWNQKTNLRSDNAFDYGKFIGTRYRKYNKWIIWVMGGDADPDTEEKKMLHRKLAAGIATGINGTEQYDNLMMTYHTQGPSLTNKYFSEAEPFMDFNSIQSGQGLNRLKYLMEESRDSQNKPTINLEPFYDKNGTLVNEARIIILRSIFSGGFGTSYGSWNIWHCGGRNDIAQLRIPDSFEEGYGAQIGFLKNLLTPEFIRLRIPNQKLLVNSQTEGSERVLANSSADSCFICVYSPTGASFTLDLNYLSENKLKYKWFNPGNGKFVKGEIIRKEEEFRTFNPPTSGPLYSPNDWVLIVGNKASNLF